MATYPTQPLPAPLTFRPLVTHAIDAKDNAELFMLISTWLSSPPDPYPVPDADDLSWALYKSVCAGSLECARLLLDNGADPNYLDPETNEVVLDAAVKHRLESAVFALLECGAKPTGNALFEACSGVFTTIVKALIAHGADANAKKKNGSTPLIHLGTAPPNPDYQHEICQIAKLLVEKGAQVNAADNCGQTVVHTAAMNGHADLLKALRAGTFSGMKGDLFQLDHLNKSALHNAAESQSQETIDYLLGLGLDPNAFDYYDYTPLHLAAIEGNIPCVSLMLARGADPNLKRPGGGTALHLAAEYSNLSALSCLLEWPDTDPLVRDKSGKTAFTYALARSSPESRPQIVRDFSLAWIKDSNLRTETERRACEVDVFLFDGQLKGQSVNKLLYSSFTTDWVRSSKPGVGLIHLPANNIKWTRTLLARVWLARGCKNMDGYLTLLDRLEQGTPGVPGPSAYLEPAYCLLPDNQEEISMGSSTETKPKPSSSSEISASGQPERCNHDSATHCDTALGVPYPQLEGNGVNERQDETMTACFMPFIQYEGRETYQDMIDTILAMKDGTNAFDSLIKQADNIPSDEPVKLHTILNSRCKAAIHAYLHHSEPLHPRRTLSQYIYSGLETTLAASQRLALEEAGILGSDGKVILVDQLWLFTFGQDLIIACFPDQWDPSSLSAFLESNPSRTIDRIRSFFSGNSRSRHIENIQAVAASISNLCANAVELHNGTHNIRFNDVFEAPLTKLVARETLLFARFRAVSKESRLWLEGRKDLPKRGSRNRESRGEARAEKDYTVLDDLLDIGQETEMLTGLKDLQEEINIVRSLVDSQITLLTEANAIRKQNVPGKDDIERFAAQQQIENISQDTIQQLEARKRDLDRMDSRAKTLQNNLTSLLDLERIQSNVLEAKFARDQAVLAARQGQTVLMFTVVTIIFLPISFVATIFTINFKEWGDGEESLLSFGFVFKYIFGIGVAVSVPLVVMALSVASIVDGARRLGFFLREGVLTVADWISSHVPKGSVEKGKKKTSHGDDEVRTSLEV
ncbi:hypothetical protein QBC44DRAFT_292324 [Cladorrhinum sp. PSN332]|nr:hypothetical protein QBC44DRAFT_292324 [Cladorrhinum sp. PSN332]